MPTIVVGGRKKNQITLLQPVRLESCRIKSMKLCECTEKKIPQHNKPVFWKKQYSKCTKQVQGFKRLSEWDECAAVVNYGTDVQMEVELEL